MFRIVPTPSFLPPLISFSPSLYPARLTSPSRRGVDLPTPPCFPFPELFVFRPTVLSVLSVLPQSLSQDGVIAAKPPQLQHCPGQYWCCLPAGLAMPLMRPAKPTAQTAQIAQTMLPINFQAHCQGWTLDKALDKALQADSAACAPGQC